MKIQGGKWDYKTNKLIRNEDMDMNLKKMPVIHLIPKLDKKPVEGAYLCPLYRNL